MKYNNVSVVGLGYIGIPILLKISENKLIKKLYGIDTNQHKIDELNSGKFKFTDNLQKKYYKKNKNKILFSSKLKSSNVYFITISNSKKLDDNYYLKNILKVLDQIILVSNDNSIIILETTLKPGFSKKIINHLRKNKSINFFNKSNKKNMCFCYMAEKIIPGNTISELGTIPRLISITNPYYKKNINTLLNNIFGVKIIFDDFEITEYVKIIENTYRNYSIGFTNYLSMFFDDKHINFYKIFKYANLHPRINILSPSIGVGGHCIPLDPLYLLNKISIKNKNPIYEAYNSNLAKENWVVNKVKYLKKKYNLKLIIMGITYKENIEDFRESASINIINSFKSKVGIFYGYDPYLKNKPETINNKSFVFLNSQISLKNLCENNYKDYLFLIFVKHTKFIKILKNNKKINYYDFCGLFNYEYIINN